MDAIIFFGRTRELKTWKLSLMYREDYLLAKVEADIGRENWFGREMPRKPQPPEEALQGGRLHRRRERKRRQKEYQRLLEEYGQSLEALHRDMDRMCQELLEAVENAGALGELYSVYAGELAFLGSENGSISECWQQHWRVPEFQGYKELRWVKPLLTGVEAVDFIILGAAECIPVLLEQCARRMKSLCWYLPEECVEEVQELAEEFYVDSGLAAALYPLGGKHPFRTLRLKSGERVCVLDFSGEEKVFAGELKPGSVWLDFCPKEEKKRRLRRTAPDVTYDSMVVRWETERRNTSERPEKLRNMGQYSRFS